jgi:hypothetical protein
MSRAILPAVLTALLLLVGCGSSNTSSTSNTPTATGTSAPPPSSGSGGTSGGSGGTSGGSGGNTGGGSQEAPKLYTEAIMPIGDYRNGGGAAVSPSTTGSQYSLTLAGGTNDGASYVARFCPFAVAGCMTLSDQPGFRSSGFQFIGTFPGHGTFSGEFIISRNGVDILVTGFSLPANGSIGFSTGATPFQPQLVRAAAVSAALGAQSGVGTDPLTDGSATVTQPDGTVHPSVTGASPSTAYTVSYCKPDGTGCVALGALTTDGSGNGSAALSIAPAVSSGDLNSGQFKLSRNGATGPVEFVTGFIVP